MTVVDRIILFAISQKIPISTFERKSNLPNGYIKKLKNSPGVDKIEVILRTFPEINRTWLITGEGEMIEKQIQTQPTNTNSIVVGDNYFGYRNNISNSNPIEFDSLKTSHKQLEIEIKHLKEILEEKERLIQVLINK